MFGSTGVVGVVPGCVAGSVCAGLGRVVAGGCVTGAVSTPGGFCGAGRVVPGGVRGSCGFVREPGGTVCCCCVPGGRVASRCAGVCGGGVDCGTAAAVSTTKGSPSLVKMGLAAPVGCVVSAPASGFGSGVEVPAEGALRAAADLARDFAPEGVFPKADTAFPKTRSAERLVEARTAEALRLASIDRLSLTIFSTLKLFRRAARRSRARDIKESKRERPV